MKANAEDVAESVSEKSPPQITSADETVSCEFIYLMKIFWY